jgi:hypothetical protein
MSAAAVGPGGMGPGPPGPLAPPIGTHHLGAHTVHGAHMTHPPSLAASPSTSTDKIRKKSAHWADSDTDKLLEVLLRNREKGRTADNGFEPEVWQEAARCLENTNGTGGEKTPDACRSRWQRLQREFKFARQYLEECHGFSWDRSKHKLQASDESWAQAERKVRLQTGWRLMRAGPPDQEGEEDISSMVPQPRSAVPKRQSHKADERADALERVIDIRDVGSHSRKPGPRCGEAARAPRWDSRDASSQRPRSSTVAHRCAT